MDSFARFILDGATLDAAAVRAAGLAARPFPDYGNNEVAGIARVLGAEQAQCWSCEYRGRPHYLAATGTEDAGSYAVDFGYLNVLIVLDVAQTHIWLPDHHEFFVIFARSTALEKIRAAGLFPYSYDEYANEPYFGRKRAKFLIDAGRCYTIDPSSADPPADTAP